MSVDGGRSAMKAPVRSHRGLLAGNSTNQPKQNSFDWGEPLDRLSDIGLMDDDET